MNFNCHVELPSPEKNTGLMKHWNSSAQGSTLSAVILSGDLHQHWRTQPVFGNFRESVPKVESLVRVKRENSKKLHDEVSLAGIRAYLDFYEEKYRELLQFKNLADWTYHTNITLENSAQRDAASLALFSWQRNEWMSNISNFDTEVLESYEDEELRRRFHSILVLGVAALDDQKLQRRNQLVTEMTSIYASAKICPFEDKNCTEPTLSLEPDLENIMATCNSKKDYDLLAHVWKEWRDATGRKMRDKFLEYVQLTNDAAIANNDESRIASGADLWLRVYETEGIQEEFETLYGEAMEFYRELHAMVRYKLRLHFGEDKIDPKGPIPAHLFATVCVCLLGNYSVRQMFQLADNFLVSLGLVGLQEGSPNFYENSMLEKPGDGREVLCHAFAFDMMATNKLPGDFRYPSTKYLSEMTVNHFVDTICRIKQCTSVNFDDFITIHHEMGHVQYYMQYVKQSPLFRDGANPGTLFYWKDLHSCPSAMWRVFQGIITKENLNTAWWKLVEQYQGITPPVKRNEDYFDAGAKFHVANDVQYAKYFVARILQFQFHQALCEEAGQFNPYDPDEMPLHECDIMKSKAAGRKLRQITGSSRHWKEVLLEFTGREEMSLEPMLNYFKPLRKYLKQYVEAKNLPLGWEEGSRRWRLLYAPDTESSTTVLEKPSIHLMVAFISFLHLGSRFSASSICAHTSPTVSGIGRGQLRIIVDSAVTTDAQPMRGLAETGSDSTGVCQRSRPSCGDQCIHVDLTERSNP
ncbi:unnamed protein product [Notodromas monacha]|uniref:Angiotensin-converting enzyme n=1 Tax=Notodromas monacha TaxID=399045 RepID=A0A7R9BX36_9CRUS|nr:unnamed protein product [Notodromas monacha]CAG0923400.1 unnamed protein product [Notodromas monacha]